MRKTIFVSVVCLLASTIVVGEEKFQPLNIKPGQWQVTETFSATGLPAKTPGATQTITYKSCVTQKDLTSNPFNDPHQKCAWTVLNSTASDMELKGESCSLGEEGMKANVHLKLHAVDSEHANGSGEWTATGNGMSMSGNATGSGKWISATCPSE